MNHGLAVVEGPSIHPSILSGLGSAEVKASRLEHGQNLLTSPIREPWWRLYLGKFEDPVIRILMMAALLAVGVGSVHGEYLEGIGIIAAILLATALAFVNEFRASLEFDVLNRVDDEVPVQVLREGVNRAVARKELVVGDLVMIEMGEAVPADGRILESFSLAANEASLTGESLPVAKSIAGASLQDREEIYPADLLLRGTTIADGHGVYHVTAVGDGTEIGGVVRQSRDAASTILFGQILIVQFGGEIFRTVPLSLHDWIAILAGTSPVLWAGEIRRFLLRMRARPDLVNSG